MPLLTQLTGEIPWAIKLTRAVAQCNAAWGRGGVAEEFPTLITFFNLFLSLYLSQLWGGGF